MPDMPEIASDRAPHWIRPNHQCRIPKRWVVFDTEATSRREFDMEVQEWSIATAKRWRRGLKGGDHAENAAFFDPAELWTWITEFCRPEMRTIAVAHNLGYDIRISDCLEILPRLGWELVWSNLDRNVSSMTWRSERGTLVLADSFTWLPIPVKDIGPMVGLGKMRMPREGAPASKWIDYCMNDTEIIYRAMTELVDYVDERQLGNLQPTGAGMAYSTWRHKYMRHKVLVHDDVEALAAERAAMHTGRAEAWRHGEISGERWTELDMTNAYVTIARDCELPTKLRFKTGALTAAQYRQLCSKYRVLCEADVTTSLPVVPYRHGCRTVWPVGSFTTWLWDTEVDLLVSEGQRVRISSAVVYTREPILREWAEWILGILDKSNTSVSPVVKTWIKHSGRALIGRISLRVPRWEYWGANPGGRTAISHLMAEDGDRANRLLHVGNKTFIETARIEGRDSLPQVTSAIMSECRARLWEVMRTAGLDTLAHVDTDSLIVSAEGLRRLTDGLSDDQAALWAVKGTWRTMDVYGPRAYRVGRTRRISGVPVKAEERTTGDFYGERWTGVTGDIERGNPAAVTITPWVWHVHARDPRRIDRPGVPTYTSPIDVG